MSAENHKSERPLAPEFIRLWQEESRSLLQNPAWLELIAPFMQGWSDYARTPSSPGAKPHDFTSSDGWKSSEHLTRRVEDLENRIRALESRLAESCSAPSDRGTAAGDKPTA